MIVPNPNGGGFASFPDHEEFVVYDNLAGTEERTCDVSSAWFRILGALRDPLAGLDMEIYRMIPESGSGELLVSADVREFQPYRLVKTCLDGGMLCGFSAYSYPSVEEAGQDFPCLEDETVLTSLIRAEPRGQPIPEDRWREVWDQAAFDVWDQGGEPGEAVQCGEWRGYPV